MNGAIDTAHSFHVPVVKQYRYLVRRQLDINLNRLGTSLDGGAYTDNRVFGKVLCVTPVGDEFELSHRVYLSLFPYFDTFRCCVVYLGQEMVEL